MKKRRKVFNLYNLVVIICIIVIGASLFVILNKEDNLAEGLKTQMNSIVTFAKDTISNITGGDKEEKAKLEDKQASTNVNTNTGANSNTQANQNVETSRNEAPTNLDNGSTSQEADVQGINEIQAKEIALNEFIRLGETEITIDNLQIRGVLRGGERYFEVSSSQNNVEINIKTGKIARVNNKEV